MMCEEGVNSGATGVPHGEETESRVALVTGAASGVGRAVTMRFSAAGMRVIAVDRNVNGLRGLEDQAGPGDVVGIVADVREIDELHEAVAVGVDRYERLDVVAAIAGILKVGPVMYMDHRDRDEVFGVNVFGVWNAVEAALPAILRSEGPRRILVCGSVAASVAGPGQAAYVASKHALVGLVKALALECAADAVTVNLISPASVDTEMVRQHLTGAAMDRFIETTPVRRLSTADEVAAFFEFYARAESSYATGSNVIVDGGCGIVNTHNIDSIGASLLAT